MNTLNCVNSSQCINVLIEQAALARMIVDIGGVNVVKLLHLITSVTLV